MLGALTSLGLAGTPLEELRSAILEAWDDFLDVVAAADLAKPSRLKGMTARDVCVHLGTWDDHEVLPGLVAAARSGDRSAAVSPEELNRSLLARHREATESDIVASLQRSRREIAGWLAGDEAREIGRRPRAAGRRQGPGPLRPLTLSAGVRPPSRPALHGRG